MRNTHLIIVILLASLAGCQTTESPVDLTPECYRVNSVRATMWSSECPFDLGDVDLNSEYNGTRVLLATMEINGCRLQTMGFYPVIEFVERYTEHRYVAGIYTDTYTGAYLFLRGTDDGIYLLFRGANDYPITSDYIVDSFNLGKDAVIKVDENNVYVWGELYDFLRDNKVKMPSNYIPIKFWYKDDGDEKGSTQAASQSATRSATQPTTQPKNENGGENKK